MKKSNSQDGGRMKSYSHQNVIKDGISNDKILREKWKLLPDFLKVRGLVKQHIDSYNYFINVEIKKILLANQRVLSEANPNFYLKYTNIRLGEPSVEENLVRKKVTPQECRLRDLTYSSPIYIDAEYTRGKEIVVWNDVPLGALPIMLRSSKCILADKNPSELADLGECPFDPGGYFIVKGQERVILIQEQLSKNRIITDFDAKKCFLASVTSSTHERRYSKTDVVLRRGHFFLHHNSLTEEIPLFVILKAMGLSSDQEIVTLIGSNYSEKLMLSISDCKALNIFTTNQALDYLGCKVRLYHRPYSSQSFAHFRKHADDARDVMTNVILANIPVNRYNFRSKAIFICVMARRVLQAEQKGEVDDKDSYGNKRLELAGQMMAVLFEDLFKMFNFLLQRTADHVFMHPQRASQFDILKCFNGDSITKGLSSSLATGNWRVKRFRMEKSGVSQVLSRLSFIATLGMMTRVNSQFEKSRKVSGPRALQPSHWGMLCPSDTPEGESCGLVKNLALLTHVTTDEEEAPIASLVYNLGVEDTERFIGEDLHGSKQHFLVMLNGNLLGIHRKPYKFASKLRALRRIGLVREFVSVYVHEQQRCVYLSCDGGRVCRPLIIVKNGLSRLLQIHLDELQTGFRSFTDFLREGIIEYIDVSEHHNCYIALQEEDINQETTHLEIDPMTILGVVAGLIPFPHHNQSPRNTYQCAMGKQAMGVIGFNQFRRIDTLLYLLVYPQRPLVTTSTMDFIGYNELPGGQNAIAAVMSFSGYDIEDAIILNKSSVDRGYGRCIVHTKHITSLKRYPNQTIDRLFTPPTQQTQANTMLSHLDTDGIVQVGSRVEKGDVLVNKYSPISTSDHVPNPKSVPDSSFAPAQLKFKGPAPSYVDQALVTSNLNDSFIFKVKIRSVRRPEVGDKFSSRHGQKGVCGLIVNQEDLPFNDDGICPDIIMNPHGFPSRMTVGKILELVTGKAGVLNGKVMYSNAFGNDPILEASQILIENGFSYTGKDCLTSGITGETVQAYIFMGPVYYQKLKHMVLDKVHARARGPRAMLTRQPTEGRSRDGGLRLGEMERDCLIAHGVSSLLVERLSLSSDVFRVHVCQVCGLMGYNRWCQFCRRGGNMVELEIPYACKLLFQELQAINVVVRFELGDI